MGDTTVGNCSMNNQTLSQHYCDSNNGYVRNGDCISWEELHYNKFILEGEVESSYDESECDEKYFSILHKCLCVVIHIFKSFVNIILINTHVNYNLYFKMSPLF